MLRRRGQTILEYTILIVVVIAAFISMQSYMKRGVQGRWKSAADDLGDLYDPRYTNASVNQTQTSHSVSRLKTQGGAVVNGRSGYYTMRTDEANTYDTKNSYDSLRLGQ